MDINDDNLSQIEAGHVIRLREPFLRYSAGTRGICVEHDADDDPYWRIVVCVLEGGELHAFTLDALVAMKAECVGYLPAFCHAERGSCVFGELRSNASRPGFLDRLLGDRRSTLEANVHRGAEYLDAQDPTWWNRLDLGSLDLGDGEHCVIGQLYSADFLAELQHALFPLFAYNRPEAKQLLTAGEAHGFLLPDDAHHIENETLTDLWLVEALARRGSCSWTPPRE